MARSANYKTDNPELRKAVLSLVKMNIPGEFISELESLIGQRNDNGSPVRFIYMTGIDRDKKGKTPWFRKFVTDTPDKGEINIYLLGYNMIYAPNKQLIGRKAKFVVSVVNEYCDIDATRLKV